MLDFLADLDDALLDTPTWFEARARPEIENASCWASGTAGVGSAIVGAASMA